MLVVDEDGGVVPVGGTTTASPLLLEILQPGELGKGGSKAHVAVGAVGREDAPGCPLDEAVDGEAVGKGLGRESEVDEAGRLVSEKTSDMIDLTQGR